MPEFIRWRECGATYFFSLVTLGRRPILTTPLGRQCFDMAVDAIRAKRPFEMLAWVVLPDHLHCIWRMPDRDSDFPTRWRQIKDRFTRAFLAAGGGEHETTPAQARESRRGVWQPRYWEHLIRNEREYIAYRDYIHLNPVKHRLVENPEEWPHSSVHEHLKNGWLEPEWAGRTPLRLHVGE